MNVQHIKLNIIPGGVLPVVHVSQYDHNAGGLVFDIYNGGELYELPEGTTASIEGTKPDEYGFLYPAAAVSGHSVTIDIVEQMTVVPGKVICELRLAHQQDNVGTINFILAVEPAGLSDDTEISETDIPLLREAIEAGQQAIQSASQAEISADRAEAEADRAEEAADNLTSVKTTPEGEIATTYDAKEAPLLQFKANLVPSQSGTGDPSPDNVRPISGYTGVTVSRTAKNLLPKADASTVESSGITWTTNEDGTISAVGTATGNTTRYYPPNSALLTVPKVPLIVSGCPDGGAAATYRIIIYKYLNGAQVETVNSYGGSVTIDPTDGSFDQIRVGMQVRSGATVNIVYKPMVRLAAETDATYEPYNGATYPITFPTEAGAVYGGTLTVNSDGSGTLTVDRGVATITAFDQKNAATENNVYRYRGVSSLIAKTTDTTVLCDKAPFVPAGILIAQDVIGIGTNTSGNVFVGFGLSGVATLEAANAYVAENPITVVYPLDTPTTYALSAVEVAQMLSGVNNVWTDAAGTVQITYQTQSALTDIQQDITDLQADVAAMQPVVEDLQTNAVKKSDIVQTGTVTTAGQYVVDARQLNPTLSGTIAKRITDLETGAASAVSTADITRATNIAATGTKVVDAYELNPSKTGTLAKKIADAASAASAAQSDATAAGTAAGNANTALGGFSFGFTADNKPGYKQPGADTVVPFSTGGVEVIAEVANVTAGTATPVTLATGVDLSEYQFIGLQGVTNTNQHGDCVFTLNVGTSLHVSRQIGWYMENNMSDPRVAGNRYSMFFSVSSAETNATITIQAVNKISAYQVFAQSITLYGIR